MDVEEFDRDAGRIAHIVREAGVLVLALLAAWLLINHRAFFTFPPDLSKGAGAALPTYLFLAVLLDAGLHAAFLLLRPGPAVRASRAPGFGVEPLGVAGGALRPGIARRPPRAALAEARARGTETALDLRRAIAAAQRQWEDTVAREAVVDLTTFLETENPEVPFPTPMAPENPPLRPVRVVRRVVRPVPARSMRTPSPWDTPTASRSRPGERVRPKP